jgi:hypothetical protein
MVAKAFLGTEKPSVDLVKKWIQNGRIHEKWIPQLCAILAVSEKMITGDAVILVMIGAEYQVVHDLLTQSIETQSPDEDKKWTVKASVLTRLKKQMSYRRRSFDNRPTRENGGKFLRTKK